MRGRRGFTLIELLVVIAIIAILAAILFPVFAKARAKARQTACASNLKQVGMGMVQYVQDFDERFPPSWAAAGNGNGPNLIDHWQDFIHPYIKNAGVYDCPESPDDVRSDLLLVGGGSYDGNYGVNYDGIGYTMSSRLAACEKPAEMFMVGDSGDIIMCCDGTNNWAQLMEDLDLDWDSKKEGANRHNLGCNITYLDGHTKWQGLHDVVYRPGQNQAPWFINWADNPPADNGPIPFPSH